MLTSKQRAYLRSLSNKLEPIFQVGKGGVNDNQLKQIDEALEKRELVKVHVLENALLDTRSVCNEVADALGAEPVQVIGKKFIIYKESKENKRIDLKDAELSETARIRKRAAEANQKAKGKTSKPKRFEADKPGKKFGAKTLRTRRSK
ncbi:MAG: ribosome assembly RNA-binding protein YhbY [Clostridia bacterium]|nr:ribosome assembly RNA-binding protein YhbY [Clostridia bacterium]